MNSASSKNPMLVFTSNCERSELSGEFNVDPIVLLQ